MVGLICFFIFGGGMWSAVLGKSTRKCQDIFLNNFFNLRAFREPRILKLSRLPPRSPLPSRLDLLCRCSQQLRSRMTRMALQGSLGSTGCQPIVVGSLPTTANLLQELCYRTFKELFGKLPQRTGWE